MNSSADCLASLHSSTNPYLVVDKLEWIQCRYLLIQRGVSYTATGTSDATSDEPVGSARGHLTRPIGLDPAHPLTISGKAVRIPDLAPKLEAMDRKLTDTFEDL